jgi:hypothetical protein
VVKPVPGSACASEHGSGKAAPRERHLWGALAERLLKEALVTRTTPAVADALVTPTMLLKDAAILGRERLDESNLSVAS